MRLITGCALAAFAILAYSQSGVGNISARLDEIVKLSQAHISDNLILKFATNSGNAFNVSADDLLYLKSHGVSHTVILGLLDSRSSAVARTPPFTARTIPPPVSNSPLLAPAASQKTKTPHSAEAAAGQMETVKRPEARNQQNDAANKALQIQMPGNSDVTGKVLEKTNPDHETLWLILGAIVLIAILILVILGVTWGLNDRVVVFLGKSDLVVSCIISGICYMALFLIIDGTMNNTDREMKHIGMNLLIFAGVLMIYSVGVAYVANMMNIRNTLLVLLTKQVLAGLLTLFGALLIGGVKSGIESHGKAAKIDGNSAEDKKEIARHKKDAAGALMVAAFAAALIYPLYKLIKNLIKDERKEA
jgi:hypothetical protein